MKKQDTCPDNPRDEGIDRQAVGKDEVVLDELEALWSRDIRDTRTPEERERDYQDAIQPFLDRYGEQAVKDALTECRIDASESASVIAFSLSEALGDKYDDYMQTLRLNNCT